jgi:hypothetical protein
MQVFILVWRSQYRTLGVAKIPHRCLPRMAINGVIPKRNNAAFPLFVDKLIVGIALQHNGAIT